MDSSILVSSFVLLFLAEMGDKTQLMAMTLAHRYRPLPVIGGVFAAFLALNVLAVLVGETLFQFVPRDVILFAAGTLFVFFAVRLWRDAARNEETSAGPTGGQGAFISSFALIFVAELGDKTQLAMIALVAGTGDPWAVFVGGTAALWTVSLIGIALGTTLLKRVPGTLVHRAAALLFLVFGILAIGQVVHGWRVGGV